MFTLFGFLMRCYFFLSVTRLQTWRVYSTNAYTIPGGCAAVFWGSIHDNTHGISSLPRWSISYRMTIVTQHTLALSGWLASTDRQRINIMLPFPLQLVCVFISGLEKLTNNCRIWINVMQNELSSTSALRFA